VIVVAAIVVFDAENVVVALANFPDAVFVVKVFIGIVTGGVDNVC